VNRYIALLSLLFCASVQAQTVVDVRSFGAIANDGVPDTPAFIAAMSGGGRTVNVPVGEYLVGKFEIPSNTTLQLETGTVLRDTGLLLATEPLITIRSENVRINTFGAAVLANRATYTTGEFRHGVFIFGARNVTITGLESSQHGGDGFYIGGGSVGVNISSCRGTNNRRQGMSIVSVRDLKVTSCIFNETAGTRPSLGIDIEPNNNADILQNIEIRSVRTIHNAGGGISVGLSAFTAAAAPVSITIIDHTSTNESPVFVTSSLRALDFVSYRRSTCLAPCTR